MKKNLTSYLSISLFMRRHSKAVLLLSVVVTLATLYLATHLEFKTDYLELMPDSWLSVSNLNAVKEEFRGFGQLIPMVETDNIDNAKVFVRDFAREIEKLPEVEYVEYKYPYEFFQRYKYLYLAGEDLETIEERIDNYVTELKRTYVPISFLEEGEEEEVAKPDFSDIVEKYVVVTGRNEHFISSDNRFMALIVQPKLPSSNLEESKALIKKVQEIEKRLKPTTYDPSINVGYTGMPQKQIDRRGHIIKQIKKCSLIGLLLILALLFFYFRDLSATILTSVTLVGGTIWAYGLTYILLGHVNIITGFAISIIMGLSIDYHIHLVNQYLILRRKGDGCFETFRYVYSLTNRANFMACLTTVGACILLVISKFKGFSELAIVASLGLICNFIASNTLLPAMIAWFEDANFLRVTRNEI